ncbi:hypothetical protein CKO42_04395 [Lamprobacter modestohalophilus]|uniref:Glycosyltransferase family 4 protein n=1 Tax=Lamprobacter modestohalophilus TaxID=1064514 RepID=A0A9X0W6G4_9GAMM|nr:hypothetical protein [Lamprobacter modestohalophilus]MBK1617704.1 hypothetical protein [Lamprobacter modestohalophilus]
MSLLDGKRLRRLASSGWLLPVKRVVSQTLQQTAERASLHRLEEKLRPLVVKVDAGAPRRINLLIPELHRGSLYGGYIAKLTLAQRLAAMGNRVRLVIVDPGPFSLARLGEALQGNARFAQLLEQVEVVYQGDRKAALRISDADAFIATTWWSAHLAAEVVESMRGKPFLYLIQEYEPFTYPMGSWFAMAHASYQYPHHALFSSSLLRDFFELNDIGVFAAQTATTGYLGQTAFENAIVSYTEPELSASLSASAARLQAGKGRLLFYARPEGHAHRNLYELGYLGLSRAIEDGLFADGWEFHGIGSERGDQPLPGGRTLKMLGKLGFDAYRQRLLDYDLGLSLMYTQHPSLLPLEMAAAGQLVVTNTCLNKSEQRLAALSGNLIGAVPTLTGVRNGLGSALEASPDIERRRQGAQVAWARTWDEAYHDSLMADVQAWLS